MLETKGPMALHESKPILESRISSPGEQGTLGGRLIKKNDTRIIGLSRYKSHIPNLGYSLHKKPKKQLFLGDPLRGLVV